MDLWICTGLSVITMLPNRSLPGLMMWNEYDGDCTLGRNDTSKGERLKVKTCCAALILAGVSILPGQAHAAPSARITCSYVTGLRAVILSVDKFVKTMPKLNGQQARQQGTVLLVREAHFNRRPNLLPMDLNRLVGATVVQVQTGTELRMKGNTDGYNRYQTAARALLAQTWGSFHKHYALYHCRGV